MLRIAAPEIPSSYCEKPLLSLSKKIRRQSAAGALRACWEKTSLSGRVRHGLTMNRGDIEHYNKEHSPSSAPMFMLEGKAQNGRIVLLCVFSDASAIVWRSIIPQPSFPDQATFQALPAVLRLSSSARILGGGALSLKVRKDSPNRLGLFLTSQECGGQVSLTAGWTTGSGALDYDCREELKQYLLCEAAAWSDLIDDLPVPHIPHEGEPSSGFIDVKTLKEIGLMETAKIAYAVPAFMEWRWITRDEADGLRDFAIDISAWFKFKHGALVDIEIDTARLAQKGSCDPAISARVTQPPEDCQNVKEFTRACTRAVTKILRSDLAPHGAHKLIGQELCSYRNQAPWLEPIQITRSFYNDKFCQRSAHEIVDLHLRFDSFWTEPAAG
jgi:hypothetical protein